MDGAEMTGGTLEMVLTNTSGDATGLSTLFGSNSVSFDTLTITTAGASTATGIQSDGAITIRNRDEATLTATANGTTSTGVCNDNVLRKCAKFRVCQVLDGGGRNLSPSFFDVR